MVSSYNRGPVMVDVSGYTITDVERQRLLHPAVGGVILFRRNYQSRQQLIDLVNEIKSLRQPELVVAVDHEGGRVQRFREGFTPLPAMSVLGSLWDTQGEELARQRAEMVGWVLSTELRACGIDLSFTPVLDLDWQQGLVIGNRSFHRDAHVVSSLAMALQKGLARGGMKSCGKHFPGHGFVDGDSHHMLPEDHRTWDVLWENDIQPFVAMAQSGMVAVMPAHVVYPKIDSQPAGFSYHWLNDILRQKIGFNGVIFSDDLCMEGAGVAGNIVQRAQNALTAGCDIILVCNRPEWVDELLPVISYSNQPHLAERWQGITGINTPQYYREVMQTPDFISAQKYVAALSSEQDLANTTPVGETI